MVLLVEYHIVLTAGERRHHSEIDAESCGIEHRILLSHPVRYSGFKIFMDGQCAVKERGSGQTCAIFPRGFHCGLYHLGVIGKTQVAVGSEHQHFFAVHHHLGILLRRYCTEIWIDSDRLCLLRRIIGRKLLL